MSGPFLLVTASRITSISPFSSFSFCFLSVLWFKVHKGRARYYKTALHSFEAIVAKL